METEIYFGFFLLREQKELMHVLVVDNLINDSMYKRFSISLCLQFFSLLMTLTCFIYFSERNHILEIITLSLCVFRWMCMFTWLWSYVCISMHHAPMCVYMRETKWILMIILNYSLLIFMRQCLWLTMEAN